MKNNYSLLESGWIPGHPLAFKPNAVGKIQLYNAVFDAVSDVVEGVVDAVGDVIDVAVDVVEDVGKAAEKTVQAALDDPIKTIATIAAVSTGQFELIPYINAADTLADGGSFEDALKSAAISYVAQEAGSLVGNELGTAIEYGTDPLSQQTAQLAAQSGDMLAGTTAGTIGSAAGAATAGATAAALSGGDIDQAMINALGSYLTKTGVKYSINELGQIVDQYGNEAPLEVANEIISDADDQLIQLSGPTEDLGLTTADNGDGTFTQTFDDGSTITTDASGNVISSTTYDGQIIYPGQALPSSVDPYEVDNVGTRDEGDILTGTSQDSNILGAAGNYFTNQFVNQLSRQLLGGTGTSSGSYSPTMSVGLPKQPNVSDYLSSLGYDPLTMPSPFTLTDGQASAASTSPIKLWDPGINLDWAPETKLGGLGFAGKFINKEDDQQYVNKEDEDRQKLAEEIRNRGWMTEEERQTLEQGSPYYNVDEGQDIAATGPTFDLGYAEGGLADHNPEFYSEGGASLANRYVQGDGDGTSDSVPAMLAKGEFVFPADVVSGLGNGDNEAGAKVLNEFMRSVRQHKRSTSPGELPPDSKGPLEYLKEAHKKAGKKHGRT